jgi:hypothetical protein
LKDRTEEFRSSLGPLPEDDKVELEAIIMAFGVYERSGRDPAQARTLDTILKRFVTQRYVSYEPVGLMPTLMAWRNTVAREAGLTPAAGKAEASQSLAGAMRSALSSELPDLAGAVGWGARTAEIRAVRWMLDQLASVGFNVHDSKNVVVDQLNNMGGALLFGTPADLYVPYMTVTKLGHQFALNRILVQGLAFEWSLRHQRGMNLRIKRIDIDNATIRAIKIPAVKMPAGAPMSTAIST